MTTACRPLVVKCKPNQSVHTGGHCLSKVVDFDVRFEMGKNDSRNQ
jgi:hypothetical protein